MQTYRPDEDASQGLFDGLARKLLSPTIQHKLITLTPLSPEERDQLIAAGKIVSALQNALARFPSEGTLLTEETLHQYFQEHAIKIDVASFTPEAKTELLKLVHSPKPGAPYKAARTGFPQSKIARWFKVSVSEVYRWDNGLVTPPPGYSLELRLSGDWDRLEVVLKNFWKLKSLRTGDVYNSKMLIHTDNPEFIHKHRLK